MSTSILYHLFGVKGRGIHYVHTRYEKGVACFRIDQDPTTLICPSCGSTEVRKMGTVLRRWRGLPVGGHPTVVEWRVHKVHCLACGLVRQVRVPFADPNRRYTRALERLVVDLCGSMTIRRVAQYLRIGWHTVKDILKRYLRKRFSRPRLKDLRRIAIDEISIGSRHRYLTVVLDLDSGAVVHVGEGKGAEALDGFWKRLRYSRPGIEAVAMDMSAAYISAVKTNLPDAAIVFDHFHIIGLMNEKLTRLRRDLYRESRDLLKKRVLKGIRWLLLCKPEKLDEKRDGRDRLEEALALNKPLATAYYMKEDLALLWSLPDKTEAESHLMDWIAGAEDSGIRILKEMAKTLRTYKEGIPAWYDFPISTGPLEGTNNKIKTLQRQAYGFRDQQFFTLRIYTLHTTRFELIGGV